MKRRAYSFFLFLIASVTLVSAIPQKDLPETPYNESDAPLIQATPPAVFIATFVRPRAATVVPPKRISEAGKHVHHQTFEQRLASSLFPRDPHSLQDLLCTFRI